MPMYHYNAFISYNHNPRDIRIASNLQHQLENFKVPKDVSTSGGLTGIDRIFLDTGELEVAGDLNKVICDVLEDTDYLIVICSPESKQSIWVQREIEYYLRNHTIDTILTVISDGEPFDVLPDILLYEDIEDDSEEGHHRVFREPLSCDYRLPARTARQTELPRLVAALIGCRYDDLVQRQRHYRKKRMTAVLTVSAVLLLSALTYLVWSNNQIKANLDASLIEQSRSLAIQSEQALRSGDRIGALRNALDALPSEDNKRPVVPRAVMALTRAMDYYHATPSGWESAVRRYHSYGNRHLRVEAFSDDDHVFMCELFNNGRVAVWDADTGKEVMADYTAGLFKEGSRVQNLAYDEEGKLILITADTIRILDPAKETELKNYSLSGEYFKLYDFNQIKTRCDDLVMSEGNLWIPIADVTDYEDYDDYTVRINSKALEAIASSFSRDGDEVADMTRYIRRSWVSDIEYKILRIDLSSGKTTAETTAPRRPTQLKLSADGEYIACCYSDFYDFETEGFEASDDQVVIMDSDDLSTAGSVSRAFVSDFCFDGSGNLLLCGFDRKPVNNDTSLFGKINYTDNGTGYSLSLAVDRNLELQCLNSPSCSELWSREYSVQTSGAPTLSVTADEAMISNAVICAMGNTMIITDADGRDIASLHPLSAITMPYCSEEGLLAVLDNGAITTWTYKDDRSLQAITGFNLLLGPVVSYTEAGEYMFAVSIDQESNASSEIMTQYQKGRQDPAWESYEYDESSYAERGEMTLLDDRSSGESFIEIRGEEKDAAEADRERMAEILVRDSNTGKVLKRHTPVISSLREDTDADEPQYTEFRYSGTDTERGKVYFLDNKEFLELTLLTVDIETGKEEKTVLNTNKPGSNGLFSYPLAYDILQPVDLYNAYVGTAGIYDLDGEHINYAAMEASYSKEVDDYVFGMVILDADPETGEITVHKITEPAKEFEGTLYGNVRINSVCRRLTCLEGTHFTTYDYTGKKIWSGEELRYEPAGFTLSDDGTVTALERKGSAGVLHFYDPKKGSEKTSASTGSVNILSHEKMACEDISDEERLVIAGDDAYIIDIENLELRTAINDTFIAYNPETRQFMLGDPDDRETGHVPYRTLQQMVDEANKYLEE